MCIRDRDHLCHRLAHSTLRHTIPGVLDTHSRIAACQRREGDTETQLRPGDDQHLIWVAVNRAHHTKVCRDGSPQREMPGWVAARQIINCRQRVTSNEARPDPVSYTHLPGWIGESGPG